MTLSWTDHALERWRERVARLAGFAGVRRADLAWTPDPNHSGRVVSPLGDGYIVWAAVETAPDGARVVTTCAVRCVADTLLGRPLSASVQDALARVPVPMDRLVWGPLRPYRGDVSYGHIMDGWWIEAASPRYVRLGLETFAPPGSDAAAQRWVGVSTGRPPEGARANPRNYPGTASVPCWTAIPKGSDWAPAHTDPGFTEEESLLGM